MRLTVGVEIFRSTANDMGIARTGAGSDWGDSVNSERKILHSVNCVKPINPYVALSTIELYYATRHAHGYGVQTRF